jgi:hypothetical protein
MQTLLEHHWLGVQFVSSTHDVPQAPLAVLHTVPSGCPTQSAELVHLLHEPASAPLATQYGFAEVVHALVDPLPLSPSQGAHVPLAVLHVGDVPLQSDTFVAEHTVHSPDVRHAGAVASGQARVAEVPLSPLHAAHVAVVVLHVGSAP